MVASTQKRLSGTTWDVYLTVLTAGEPVGVRDVWRNLDLSSPSLAQYHINKLLGMKLIETTPEGKYKASEEEQLYALRSFIRLRGRLIPRLVLYSAIVAGMLFSYLVLWPFRWDFRDLLVVFVSLFCLSVLILEAHNQYKGLKMT